MSREDYELVYLAQDGNEEAINLLYQKYKPIIIKKSKNAIIYAPHHGIDINDIMQEGFIGFDEAIRDFSQDQSATFYTFALLCIDRQITNYLKKTTGGKGKILNDAVTIDETLEKVIGDGTNIESNLMGRDRDGKLIDEIRNKLTIFEKKVFDNLNMSIDNGEFIIILGGNGTGKSTLMNLISVSSRSLEYSA